MSLSIIYNIQNAIVCLGALIGIGMGVFLIVRKRKMAGILALVGFILFSVEPLTSFMLLNVLSRIDIGGEAFNYIYPCVTTPALLLGCIALAAGFFLMLKPETKPLEDNDQTQE
jgi:hypothetical protein